MKGHETAHAERVAVIERHLAGETLGALAESLGLNRFTIRHWWRAYRDAGWDALLPRPQGPPVVGPLGRFDPLVKYVALRLKREHPGWGLPILRLHMQRRPSLEGVYLPKNTALWAYLHQFGPRLLAPRRLFSTRPHADCERAQVPHQCWEMDFKGDEIVQGCQSVVMPLGLCDEASGAPLLRVIHSLKAKGNRQGVTMRQVQDDLRKAFAQWGLADAIRMDRDSLFIGSTKLDWPGTLLLWLVGLGVQPVINRAYHPTDNAIVERSHRTWQGDVLVGVSFSDIQSVQAVSDQALDDRRRCLPSRHKGCHGQPPAEAFPCLMQARRPYSVDQESTLFDLKRVDAYLAGWKWRRQVDSIGKISLADHNYRIGKRYHGQVVKVQFDPSTREFLCALANGDVVARLVLNEVTTAYILGQGV